MKDTYAVVLAAGKGTRMKSKLHKVLHPLCGKPMVEHVLQSVRSLGCQDVYVVVGHDAETVQSQLGPEYIFVSQEEQLGTGHAVMMVRDHLSKRAGQTVVLYGDTPLLTEDTLQRLVQQHEQSGAAVTVLTASVDQPAGYGRVIRDSHGQITRIVEHKDASAEQLRVHEINSGIYCFDNDHLVYALDQLTNDNEQQEYYLTDCLEIIAAQGERVEAYVTNNTTEIIGINDRVALATATKLMRHRINEQHMLKGVTIIDPESTYIDSDVQIGQDTIIYPGTTLSHGTSVGEECEIGPHTELEQAQVGARCSIVKSTVVDSVLGDDCQVGPYAYIRPDTHVGQRCKVGVFVELKNSMVKDDTKVPHLSYVGDADIGKRVNIGCGAITVNFDGLNKHRTVIGDDSFVGCNVNLIAPVQVGDGAYIAAGSTITDPVPPHSLAIARQRQTNKEQYVHKNRHQAKSPKAFME